MNRCSVLKGLHISTRGKIKNPKNLIKMQQWAHNRQWSQKETLQPVLRALHVPHSWKATFFSYHIVHIRHNCAILQAILLWWCPCGIAKKCFVLGKFLFTRILEEDQNNKCCKVPRYFERPKAINVMQLQDIFQVKLMQFSMNICFQFLSTSEWFVEFYLLPYFAFLLFYLFLISNEKYIDMKIF